jgi:hypothetical protein
MALLHDIELANERMLRGQAELIKYVEGTFREPGLHMKLIQEVRDASSEFLSLVEQLAPRPRF